MTEAETLRAAADILRKYHWRNEREIVDIELFADEVETL